MPQHSQANTGRAKSALCSRLSRSIRLLVVSGVIVLAGGAINGHVTAHSGADAFPMDALIPYHVDVIELPPVQLGAS